MDRREFLKNTMKTLVSTSLMSSMSSFAKSEYKPNILLINSDDLGTQLSCYGDDQVDTPNIDYLAERGTKFETCWVTQASCSPSRSSIHTGLYTHQNGQIGLTHRGYSMNKEYMTITSKVKKSGYRTGVIGKFHIKPESSSPFDFEFRDPEVWLKQRDVRKMNKKAKQFMTASDSPFLLMYNPFDPHRPFDGVKKGLPKNPLNASDVDPLPHLKVNSKDIRRETAGYYNCIKRLDTGVGELMTMIEECGKLDDTIVIFMGDHGPPFTRAKTTCYDIGLRVPLIISGTNMVKKGQVRNEMVSTIDIFPTILNIIGNDSPDTLPGRSLLPLLQGRKINWRNYLFAEHNTHTQNTWFPRRSVRDKQYHLVENLLPGRENPIKGVDGCSAWEASQKESLKNTKVKKAYDRYHNPPRYELYDVKQDPYEFENLADQDDYSKIKNRLIQKLNNWRRKTNDPLLNKEVLKEYTKRHDKAQKMDSEALPEGFLEDLPGL